jgi:hypothetical protein
MVEEVEVEVELVGGWVGMMITMMMMKGAELCTKAEVRSCTLIAIISETNLVTRSYEIQGEEAMVVN